MEVAIIVEKNIVYCPFCNQKHKHGNVKNGEIRSAHCGRGDYLLRYNTELKTIFIL